ncbi:MAG: hypothetical protein WCA15_17820 [Candidatus Acidiferrales bacterium]
MSVERAAAAKQAWAWPDSLDALVAAAGNHTLLFENERVRVVQTRISAGDRTPVHTHRWPSVLFVFASSDLVRFDERGNVLMDTREAGQGLKLHSPVWQEPLPPHAVKNVGGAEFCGVQVEMKDVR